MAESEGFASPVSSSAMITKTQLHSSQYSCTFQALSYRSLAYTLVTPVCWILAFFGISRYQGYK